MPKGLAEHKRRYSNRRAARQHWHEAAARFAASQPEIKRLYREDLHTGEITEINRSKFEREVEWYMTFSRWGSYSPPSAIVWDEMTRGAIFFTNEAMFWIEKVPVVSNVRAA